MRYRNNRNRSAEKEYRKKIRKCTAAALILMPVLALVGCKADISTDNEDNGKVKVVTTIFPQYDFVRQIAGGNVELSMLLKPGEETHSYEPTPQDIIQIQNCDLFIYVGGENDEWVEDILDSMDTSGMELLRLVDCVETVNEEHVEGMKEERGHDHDHGHEEEDIHMEEHETGTPDEHVWTSPENAEAIVDNISNVLCRLDSRHAALYQENEKAYKAELEELDSEFRKTVEEDGNRLLLFGDRFPFRYFADAYSLDYYAAFPGCASDTEPSAATMAFLINKVKQEDIPVVLKMELSNANISEAIAEATGAEVRTFYSCHNLTAEQFESGETYLSMMKKNVKTLKEALADGTD